MQNETIRVGVIGASPTRGWARETHLPAIRALPQFSLAAVSTTRMESAQAAAREWNAASAYADAWALAADADVDLVVVSVKCPDHHAPVRAALEAGKAVLCEWPLAANMEQVRDLASLAAAKGLPTFMGLQARAAPAVAHARDLVAEGYVGRVLNVSVVSAASGIADVTDDAHAYSADRTQGNSVLSIAGGHTLDALCHILGDFAEVSAVVRSQYATVRVVETGELLPKTSPDHVSVTGLLESGTVATAHIVGGVRRGPGVRIDIRGTEGDLRISSDGPHIIEMAHLRLEGARGGGGALLALEPITIPDSYRIVSPELEAQGTVFHVAQLYATIARDLREGTRRAPDFALALKRHELLDAIARAAETGQRQRL